MIDFFIFFSISLVLLCYNFICYINNHTMKEQTNTKLFEALKDFDTISLEQLNATMSLMERIEKKYMIKHEDL